MSTSAGPRGAAQGASEIVPAPRLGAKDFARLHQAHFRLLWCTAAAMLNDRSSAQDIVQQAAVVGLQRLDSFDPATSFTAWMVQIVRNLALNEGRKRARRRAAPLDSSPQPAADAPTGPPMLTSAGRIAPHAEPFDDAVLHALGDLDETARACLLLRVVLDLSYRDISLALDVPEGTAASHVHRSRAALRRRLSALSAKGAA